MIPISNYIAFAGIGFLNGVGDLWNSFKEDTHPLKKIAPSITNGLIFALTYVSVPYFSNLLLDYYMDK